jgi:Tol biopolymer transport system component
MVLRNRNLGRKNLTKKIRRRGLFETLENRHLLAYGPASLVSVNNTGSASADATSYVSEQTLSADGRYLVFQSDAANIAATDTNGTRDVFVRDLQSGAVTLVSRASVGTTANSWSSEAAISANGEFVVFSSTATDLDVTGTSSTNGSSQIYRWQRSTGVIELVSKDVFSLQGANAASGAPSISGDGSRVAFETYATNLDSGIPQPAPGNYFAPTTGPMTWTDAEALAVANGGHLASIADQFEQDFIATISPEFPIGLGSMMLTMRERLCGPTARRLVIQTGLTSSPMIISTKIM